MADLPVIPRPPPASLAGRAALKTPWDFYKSIFKDYKPDTESLLDNCFEVDWGLTKCEKLIKSEEEAAAVKAYMKSVYKMIRETFKYNSGIAP